MTICVGDGWVLALLMGSFGGFDRFSSRSGCGRLFSELHCVWILLIDNVKSLARLYRHLVVEVGDMRFVG